MKHLKKIDEIFKSTYHSAASKLKDLHPKRSAELMSWAKERGESEFSKPNLERDYHWGFVFSNNKFFQEEWKSGLVLGTFYITSAERGRGYHTGYFGILVQMTNEWGQKIEIEITWDQGGYLKMKFSSIRLIDGKINRFNEVNNFLFDNRIDAKHFLKYVNEWIADFEPSMPTIPNVINKLYYTQ